MATNDTQNDIAARMDALVAAISAVRAPVTASEYQLHDLIADALGKSGFTFTHEARLGPRCRVDFVADRVGLEVKRGKPDSARLLMQCARYCRSELIDGLIVIVDTRAALPNHIIGKPLRVVGLNRLWGIALP